MLGMSGIAGIFRFDGKLVERAAIEKMTAAMVPRGPDGIDHWVSGSVGLGQCMLRTTPESLEESQPLANDDQSLVLVMDGRVDNWLDLRRELRERGVVLRDRSDAELVLRAYELWGELCVDRIIGECVFFVWDARRQTLFGSRDPAGTRHFYYHEGEGWFGFASEIKGLLALGVGQKLNESRLVDYLVQEFDRDDQIGTFYRDIVRLPAGNAIRVVANGVQIWRWWNPSELEPASYRSLDSCAEAFREQLEIAVKCRLRAIRPMAAQLSGGLDSSSIVAVIGKVGQTELGQALRTFTLIRSDRENCPDWRSVRHMLNEEWLSPTVITSELHEDIRRAFLDAIPAADEPFAFPVGLPLFIVCSAARAAGCGAIMDGMAGDLLFYGFARSLDAIRRAKLYRWLPAVLTAAERHGFRGARRRMARSLLAAIAPDWFRGAYRSLLDKVVPPSGLDQQLLLQDWSRRALAPKRAQKRAQRNRDRAGLKSASDQAVHARVFTSGLLSFAHERKAEIALSHGIEPRSPYSDRRMIEFAIRMPVEAKLCAFWYKNLLRKGMVDTLPEAVRWRTETEGHPGWAFYQSLTEQCVPLDGKTYELTEQLMQRVDFRTYRKIAQAKDHEQRYAAFRILVLSEWLKGHEAMLRDSFGEEGHRER
jgi:asparagine synthase (glutamine-hydrolysing)